MVLRCFYKCCFKCFICLETYIASVASRCFKSRSGVASRSFHAFGYLASLSPPSFGAGWTSELEVQAGAAPSPSSQCWWRVVVWQRGRGRVTASTRKHALLLFGYGWSGMRSFRKEYITIVPFLEFLSDRFRTALSATIGVFLIV